MVGTTLGPYRIDEEIGHGGMGRVYRAHDTALHRYVAIKVLPDGLASDPDRLMRFEREAQALAALNHPNIAHVYGLERNGGTPAIVMELVEGPTLADRIAQGPIPLTEALPIARQMAEALEAAHERGIVHRDLKPANVKVRDDGTVKLLDFGLAKDLAPNPTSPEADDLANAPTRAARVTQVGVVLGTAAYMAPEQTRGKLVDKRVDVWAFGVVLFEMLAGRPPFRGEELSLLFTDIMRADPQWEELPSGLSSTIAALLGRCLEKDPKRRLRDIGEARIAIDEALGPSSDAGGPQSGSGAMAPARAGAPTRFGPKNGLTWFFAALACLLVLGNLVSWFGPVNSGDRPVSRFTIPVPDGLTMGLSGVEPPLAVSPDGRSIAYESGGTIYLRRLEEDDATPVAEGLVPFFSPDSQQLGFWSPGGLQAMNLSDRTTRPIQGPQWQLTSVFEWSDEGVTFSELRRTVYIPSQGGQPVVLSSVANDQEAQHRFPQLLPGGLLLVTIVGPSMGWDDSRVVLVDRESGDRLWSQAGVTFGRYLSSGYLTYGLADGTILAQPFDLAAREDTAEPAVVLQNVQVGEDIGSMSFAVSADGGTAAYVRSSGVGTKLLRRLDRQGRLRGQFGAADAFDQPTLSLDGTRIAMTLRGLNNDDIYVVDVTGGTSPRRITFGTREDETPIWSSDGRRLAYTAYGGQERHVYVRDPDSGESEKLVYTSPNHIHVTSWSHDDRWLVGFGVDTTQRKGIDLWLLELGDTPEATNAFALLASAANETEGHFSPDGRWLAYQSDENDGRYDVFVMSWSDGEPGNRQQVSTDGGIMPRWSPDGSELFYLKPEGDGYRLIAVAPGPGGQFSTISREELFEIPRGTDLTYSVMPGGDEFMVLVDNPEAIANEIHVIENFLEVIKAKVGR